jgi:hypothetical protein
MPFAKVFWDKGKKRCNDSYYSVVRKMFIQLITFKKLKMEFMKINFVLKTTVAGVFIMCLILFSCKKEERVMRSKEYALAANGTSGVTGKVLITENPDASFNVAVTLNKSEKDTVHLVRLYNGRVDNPGILAHNLFTIKGGSGQVSGQINSIKQIKGADNTTKNVTYDSIIAYNAFVKVHFSNFKSDSVMCLGNVGK